MIHYHPSMQHLYVHVPFCKRRCTYCDFAIAVRKAVPATDFVLAIAAELAMRVPDRPDKPLTTVYLGGGTPSLLGADGVAALMDAVRARLPIAKDAEVPLEANPDDVSAGAVTRWRASGVTRLSIGAQSFDARALEWMHRTHDAAQIARAIEGARAGGISEISLDLIFALPDALARDWERDLAAALAFAPRHVSVYGLTVEERTPLGRWHARGEVHEAPEEQYAREFLRAHERLEAAGFEHYEVSNFAKPGARARHNSVYWRRVPYLGVGPSAHSFDGERRAWNAREYAAWSRAVLAGEDPTAGSEALPERSVAAERVYLGLRTSTGIPLSPDIRSAVRPWFSQGWAMEREGHLRLTAEGWLRLDSIAAHLTAVTSRS